MFPNRIHFTQLGRTKGDLIENVKDESHFFRIVSRYLLSRDIDFDYDPEINEGSIIVGGFRIVGKFKVLPQST